MSCEVEWLWLILSSAVIVSPDPEEPANRAGSGHLNFFALTLNSSPPSTLWLAAPLDSPSNALL